MLAVLRADLRVAVVVVGFSKEEVMETGSFALYPPHVFLCLLVFRFLVLLAIGVVELFE